MRRKKSVYIYIFKKHCLFTQCRPTHIRMPPLHIGTRFRNTLTEESLPQSISPVFTTTLVVLSELFLNHFLFHRTHHFAFSAEMSLKLLYLLSTYFNWSRMPDYVFDGISPGPVWIWLGASWGLKWYCERVQHEASYAFGQHWEQRCFGHYGPTLNSSQSFFISMLLYILL